MLYSSAAEASTAHAVRLAHGMDSISLPISGWLVDEGVAYQATLGEAPVRGTWQDEIYTPDASFWEAGGDTFSLSILENGLPPRFETVALIAAPARELLREREDFESSNGSLAGIDPAWLPSGLLQYLFVTPNAIDGAYGLMLHAGDASSETGLNKTSWMIDGRPGGTDQVGVEAEINLEPPDSPIQLSTPTTLALVTLASRYESQDWVRVRLQSSGGQTSLQAALDPAAFNCGLQCATPWRVIPPGVPTRFALWMGYRAFGHPAHSSPVLRFTLEPTGWSRIEDSLTLSANPTLRRFAFGAFDVDPGAGLIPLQLDNLTVEAGVVSYRAPYTFLNDEFRNGWVHGGWTLEGPVQFEPSDRAYDHQMVVAARQLDLDPSKRATLTDFSPNQADTLTARFTVDLRKLNLQNGENLEIFSAASVDDSDPEIGRVLSIHLTSQADQLKMRARTTDNAGIDQHTDWIPVTAGRFPVTLRWQATHGPELGRLILWAGQNRAARFGIDNLDQRVESVSFGVQNWENIGPTRIGFRTSGSSVKQIGFDHLISFE